MKKTMLTFLLLSGLLATQAQVFQETLGVVSANTSIANQRAAKGFINSKLTFSGNAELQMSASSLGKYTTPGGLASGGANLRIANVAETDFVIDGINTSAIKSPAVGFGILKGPINSNGSELAVEYSIDGGKSWLSLSFPPLATGEGTALIWSYKITSPLPKSEKLSLRFRQTGNAVVFRIDDISVISND